MPCEHNFQIALIGVFIFTGDLQKLCFLFKHCQSVHYQLQKIRHAIFSKSVCVLDLNTLLSELPEIDVQQGQSQQTSVPFPIVPLCSRSKYQQYFYTRTKFAVVNLAIRAPRLFVILPQHLIQLPNRWEDLRTHRDVSDSTSWSSWKITTDWIVLPFVWLFYFIF